MINFLQKLPFINKSLLYFPRNASSFKRSPLAIPLLNAEEFRTKYLTQKPIMTNTEWTNIRSDLMENHKHITKVNVDATILGLLHSPDYLPTVKSYMKYLQDVGITPNCATLGRLMKLYWLAFTSGKNLKLIDENEIIKICKKITQDYEILDATTCENLIHGLVITDKWMEATQLLEMMKLSGTPTVNAYSSIIAKAFQTNPTNDIGWTLLHEMLANRKQPKCSVFINYFESASNGQHFVRDAERMLSLLGSHEIFISRNVITRLRDILNKRQINNFVTNISKQGNCDICSSSLGDVSVGEDEFAQLRDTFLDKVLISNDVFLKSNPKEMQEFLNFLKRERPYDCVIDGLNIAYSCGVKKPSHIHSNLLCTVVQYFVQRNKHVLVLGRKHMMKWPQKDLNYIKSKASVFLTNNLSQDDPFLLYATMKSGPNADFFSRDLMRSHSHLMGPELKLVFKRWQQQHQYSLISVSDNGKVMIKEPTRYFMYTQKNNSTWHVPFREEYSANTPDYFEFPDSWLCIKL